MVINSIKMKKIIKKIVSFVNSMYAVFFSKRIFLNKSSFYFVKTNVQINNKVIFRNCEISNSKINIYGSLNKIEASNSLIHDSHIHISGSDNKLILEKSVKLRGAIIHIRGKNCLIKIGNNTTTGGIRIVNVGTNNSVEIGRDCLFADNIEIWASDTHSIYNKQNQLLNSEKPVTICDRVWVGSHVIILKDVVIHSDSVIGMGSVVTKDIPKGVISAGSPNRTIKENITWKLDYKIK